MLRRLQINLRGDKKWGQVLSPNIGSGKKTFSVEGEKKNFDFEPTPNRDPIPMVRVHLGVVVVADDVDAAIDIGPVFII